MKSLANLISIFLFISSNLLSTFATDWHTFFNPNKTFIEIDGIEEVQLILLNLSADETIDTINSDFVIKSGNEQVAIIDDPDGIEFFNVAGENGKWEVNFRVKGVFLGNLFNRGNRIKNLNYDPRHYKFVC